MAIDWKLIGKRLEIARNEKPLGKQRAAESLGYKTKRTVQNHENGLHLKAELITRYAELYGVNPHWLMTGELPKHNIVADSEALYEIAKGKDTEPRCGGDQAHADDGKASTDLLILMLAQRDQEVRELREDKQQLRARLDQVMMILARTIKEPEQERRKAMRELYHFLDGNPLLK